tara:strand:- start:364 stop:624 length:261 start_codon:yes stop_codon:yes gene_type:complete
MAHENRKWVIITLANYNDEQLENLCANAIQSGVSTLRKTLDGTKAILKWDGSTPQVFDGMATYNHAEILTELAKSTWTDDSSADDI